MLGFDNFRYIRFRVPSRIRRLKMGVLILLVWGICSDAWGDEARRPNILFAIADDWGADHAGAYGCSWISTPAFDRVASEGLLFNRAYTPNAKCAPSRACILTGRNSWQLKEAGNHIGYFPAEFKTFTEVLREHGYFVGMTAKGWAPGVALRADGSPRVLIGPRFDSRQLTPPTRDMETNDYAGNFLDFLAARPDDAPWFFWYGSKEPHRPYAYGSGVRAGRHIEDIDRVPGYWPDNAVVRHDMLDYGREVEYFDEHLRQMLAILESRGELENTLVIVTSDNGAPFPRAKGQAYEFGTRLPLAIRWPAGIREPGRTVEAFVSFIDFAPTMLEVAGIPWSESGMQSSSGRSLSDIMSMVDGRQLRATRDHVLLGQERHDVGRPDDVGYPIRGIVKGDLLYLRNFEPRRWPAGNPETGYLNTDGGPTKTEILKTRLNPDRRYLWDQAFGVRGDEELYNVRTDPDCIENLVTDPDQRENLRRLREQLHAELTAQQDPRMRGEGAVFDRYPVVPEEFNDFYEKYMRGEAPSTRDWVLDSDYETDPIFPQPPVKVSTP